MTGTVSDVVGGWGSALGGLAGALGCYFAWRANRRAARAHVRLDDVGAADTPERVRRGRWYERLLYPFGEPHPGDS